MAESKSLEALAAEVVRINKNTVSAKSRAVYSGKQIAFLRWLDVHKPAALSAEFRDEMERDDSKSIKRSYAKKVLEDQKISPIDFSSLDAQDIQLFITSLQSKQGDALSYSTYNTARSAISDLYRTFNEAMPAAIRAALEKYFKGLKRTNAKELSEGKGQVRIGKSPMDFSLFRFLALRLLSMGDTDAIFGHLYMMISWNLMCRASNTSSICFSHLDWIEDSLGVYFAHQKNDQVLCSLANIVLTRLIGW
jgi:hypothetical protein